MPSEIDELREQVRRMESRLNNETMRIEREAAKIVRATYWYPVLVAFAIMCGSIAILTAVTAIIIKLLS